MLALLYLSALVTNGAWSTALNIGNEVNDFLPDRECVFVVVSKFDIEGEILNTFIKKLSFWALMYINLQNLVS